MKLILPGALAILAVSTSCTYNETPPPEPVTSTTTTTTYSGGEVVTALPSGYKTVTVSGNRYYTYGNTYYQPQGSGYVIVDSPYAATGSVQVVRELPGGYEVVSRGTDRYYRVGSTYYQQRSGGYVVVPGPF